MDNYVFDGQGMTWITCDLCSGSFQRDSKQRCTLCNGTKLRLVSYEYLVSAASAPQNPQGNLGGGGGQSSKPRKDNKRDRDRGSGRGVYNRSS